MTSPHDPIAKAILAKYDLPEYITKALHEDIVNAIGQGYRKGADDIIKQYPYREDMGR